MAIKLDTFDNRSFDRGATRFKEWLWYLLRAIFFMHFFPFPSRLKVWILRRFGARVGSGVVIRDSVHISFPWRLNVGNNVWIGDEVRILTLAEVNIEANVCISQRAYLCTGSHDFRSESFDLVVSPIVIEEGSWIGAQAFLSPGIRVGKGSQVLPGAVVTRGIPPCSVVGGVPAKVISSHSS